MRRCFDNQSPVSGGMHGSKWPCNSRILPFESCCPKYRDYNNTFFNQQIIKPLAIKCVALIFK